MVWILFILSQSDLPADERKVYLRYLAAQSVLPWTPPLGLDVKTLPNKFGCIIDLFGASANKFTYFIIMIIFKKCFISGIIQILGNYSLTQGLSAINTRIRHSTIRISYVAVPREVVEGRLAINTVSWAPE